VTERPAMRRLLGDPITARRAVRAIVLGTFAITLLCGLLMRLLDRDEFPTLGRAMWWAIQTVTTVGYGDVVPEDTVGRAIGAVLMVIGITFLTVLTAAVTAAFIESARRRIGDDPRAELPQRLDALDARLERIEAQLTRR